MDDVRIFTGTLIADLVLPGARTLKERRAPLQALIRKLRNHDLAVAQVGPAELTQRAFVAVSAVSGSAALLDDLLAEAERLFFASDFEVGELRRLGGVESFPSG